jgi:hypothetical protein
MHLNSRRIRLKVNLSNFIFVKRNTVQNEKDISFYCEFNHMH